MEINLDSEKTIFIREEQSISVTTSTITILNQIDNPVDKTVTAFIKINETYQIHKTLWEGDAYDAIGDWKQLDANNRIIELL